MCLGKELVLDGKDGFKLVDESEVSEPAALPEPKKPQKNRRKPRSESISEIGFWSGLGWIVAAVFAGAFIGTVLLIASGVIF